MWQLLWYSTKIRGKTTIFVHLSNEREAKWKFYYRVSNEKLAELRLRLKNRINLWR
jgi:hypothetical protein